MARRVRVAIDDDVPDLAAAMAELKAAEDRLRAHTRDIYRLRRLYERGLLPSTLTAEARAAMKVAFFASGKTITKCPPATAKGAQVSPIWPVEGNRRALRDVRDVFQDPVTEQVIAIFGIGDEDA